MMDGIIQTIRRVLIPAVTMNAKQVVDSSWLQWCGTVKVSHCFRTNVRGALGTAVVEGAGKIVAVNEGTDDKSDFNIRALDIKCV